MSTLVSLLGAALLAATVPSVRPDPGLPAQHRTDSTASRARLTLPVADARPRLDGVLDDGAWQRAARITDLTEYEPGDQLPAAQPSVGYVTYDAEYLYFAFEAVERRDHVRATVFPRERGGEQDDRVTLILDTFNDRRRAYEFKITPLGIQQADGVKVEGKGADNSVDFVWHSAGRLTDTGWAVEVAIPFASLRFPEADTLTFGFQVVRVFARSGRKASWAPRRRGSPCDICQQGSLDGIVGVRNRRTLDVLPFVAASQYGVRAYGRDSALVAGDWVQTRRPGDYSMPAARPQVGGDVRLALTPSVVLNATVNPDFSQVESDDEQVRVNQRFALFNQERRPFFLEGRDAFEVVRAGGGGGGSVGDLLYTRAVVDPSAGARITGRRGATQVGALYARDEAPAYFHYDGYESSGYRPDLGTPADVLVGRVRRDVLGDSYVGLSGMGRRTTGHHDVVAASDVFLRRGALSLSGETAVSRERAPFAEGSSSLDGRVRSGSYYRAGLRRSGRSFNLSAAAAAVSPDFRNQLGRYQRVGIESYGAAAELAQFPNGRVVQRATQRLSVQRTNVFGGGLLDFEVEPSLEVQLARQTAFSLAAARERTTAFGTALDQTRMSGSLRSDAWRTFGFRVNGFVGDREIFDAARPRVGKGYSASVSLVGRPTPAAGLELHGQQSLVREGWGSAVVSDARIARLRGSYQFSRALGLRAITEYSDQRNALDAGTFGGHTVRYTGSLLATYELAPASFLYVGYNDALQEYEAPVVAEPRHVRTGSSLFVKASYLLRL